MKQKSKRNPFIDYFPGFLHLFVSNGWQWHRYDGWADDEFRKYKCTFCNMYDVEVQAVVSCDREGMNVDGSLGILWLEVIGYPDCIRDESNGYTFTDLNDIIGGLILAEENLVRCGIPFSPDYPFHGANRANMKRRNDATRRKLRLDHWEEKLLQEEQVND